MVNTLTCLAFAMYFEARGELPIHQVMVANTITNRVNSKRFPNTVCAVVKQKHQFSFYWDGLKETVTDVKAWNLAVMLARGYLEQRPAITKACHYAHVNITNRWTKVLKGTVYGRHTFYEGGC